jgi:ferredoxin
VCIDCGACIPACPVHAIYDTLDIPDDLRHWADINAVRCPFLPVISDKQEPRPGAQERKAALGY